MRGLNNCVTGQMNDIDILKSLADGHVAGNVVSVNPLAAAASSRRYYRITCSDGTSYVGGIGKSIAENKAFIEIARCLELEKIPAPRVVCASIDAGAYILTDLGDENMMDVVAHASKSGEWEHSRALSALECCVASLPALQYGVAKHIDTSLCYPRGAMDRRSVLWDMNHFKYCFLKAAGAEIDEEGLENDFNRLADLIEEQAGGPFWAFIHRDCHSRNVMLASDGTPSWIDFQGGRMGPVAYDFASMVWHGRAAIPEYLRRRLMKIYVGALSKATGREIAMEEFESVMWPVLVLRLLQVLGAYGLRGITEGKAAFISPIAAVADELQKFRDRIADAGMPALASTIDGLRFLQPVAESREKRSSLTVTVISFSYKRGLPRDYSGNGGGFVFDCRYPNNPGRYAEYRHLTGRDREVIDFLEADGEMPALAEKAIEMVRPAVERYRNRGFTHLTAAFGCTGGQHRSVYGAERMAKAISELGVKVKLIHREQGIYEEFN